jgi:hypothetical protein
MAINLPDLANGLKQINTGVIPGDQRGDSFRTVLDKINSNSSITLTVNDNIAATGLNWNSTTRKVSLDIPLNYLPVNAGIYAYNTLQFGVINDTFQIIGLNSNLLTGSINPAVNNIALASNNIFIGDIQNKAVAKVASPINFELSNDVFVIKEVEYSKVTGVSVKRSQFFANDIEFALNPLNDRVTIGLIDWAKISNVEVSNAQFKGDPIEFDLDDVDGIVRIGQIDWEKIADVLVEPNQLAANTSEFDLSGSLLTIGVIHFSKISSVSITPIQMALNPLEFFTNTNVLTIKNLNYNKLTDVAVKMSDLSTDNTDTDTTLAGNKSFLTADLDDDSLPTLVWKTISNNQGTF